MAFQIDNKTCSKCGLCATICPGKVIGKKTDHSVYFIEDHVPLCVKCGQCMAVCPTKSVFAGELNYDKNFFGLPESNPDYETYLAFLSSRRSVRHFKDEPVPKEMLQKIIDSLALAPFGVARDQVHFTIVNDRKRIETSLPIISEMYKGLAGFFKNPVIRWFIGLSVKAETYTTLKNFIVPHIRKGLYDYSSGEDTITRNAPAMILFHADKNAEDHTDDTLIYLTYAFLTAHSLGLGGTVIGLVPPMITRSKKLKKLFHIPESHEVNGCLILGFPKYKYLRGISRPRTNVNWL
jgi:nitroreductase/NAD-dependent dihydropyrimidine dehydrogenase PreA subunit